MLTGVKGLLLNLFEDASFDLNHLFLVLDIILHVALPICVVDDVPDVAGKERAKNTKKVVPLWQSLVILIVVEVPHNLLIASHIFDHHFHGKLSVSRHVKRPYIGGLEQCFPSGHHILEKAGCNASVGGQKVASYRDK